MPRAPARATPESRMQMPASTDGFGSAAIPHVAQGSSREPSASGHRITVKGAARGVSKTQGLSTTRGARGNAEPFAHLTFPYAPTDRNVPSVQHPGDPRGSGMRRDAHAAHSSHGLQSRFGSSDEPGGLIGTLSSRERPKASSPTIGRGRLVSNLIRRTPRSARIWAPRP